jgi:hypothetical protein
MTATFSTTVLPPAFLGEAYEASFAGTGLGGALAVTSAVGSTDTGLPGGLVINADALRVTGTPTGLVSTPGGSGVAQTGPGAYTFTVTPLNGSGTAKQYTINVYDSPTDPNFAAATSTANQAAIRTATDGA